MKGSQISSLLHLEFQNYFMAIQNYILCVQFSDYNHQSVRLWHMMQHAYWACFSDFTNTLGKGRIICLSIHTTPSMQI